MPDVNRGGRRAVINGQQVIDYLYRGEPADWADVVRFAHKHLAQPNLEYYLDDEPAYFRGERDKAVKAGYWPNWRGTMGMRG